jgi:hypothetical protein
MIIHNYGRYPNGVRPYGDIEELDEYSLGDIEGLGVDEAWYWYETSCYEGDGAILMRIGERFRVETLAHCSCFGPTEKVTFGDNEGFNTLAELKATLSEEFDVEVAPLVEMAEAQGYK